MNNNCDLTDDAKINEIREFVKKSEKDKDLCKEFKDFYSLYDLFKFIKENAASHGVHLLTTPPPFRGMRFDD